MQRLLQDIFREAINKAKQAGVWEKLTLKQREVLVSKAILHYFKNACAPGQSGATAAQSLSPCREALCENNHLWRPDRTMQLA